jgi:uncharacterized membrane protein (DUF106 family)
MLEALNHFALRVAGFLLGWLLLLPKDLAIVVVALGSASFLMLVRKWVTNQDLLRRCDHDKKCLVKLMREAKRQNDLDALRRYRLTRGQVTLKMLRAEGKPLLVALLPLALFANWAWQRLEFHPPKPNQPIVFTVTLQPSAAGQLVHLVPVEGLQAEDGWMKTSAPAATNQSSPAQATWTLRAAARETAYPLQVRIGQQTCVHPLLVGQRFYSVPALAQAPPVLASELQLQPVKLFGLLPGLPWLACPPWLIGYLVIVVIAYPLLKRILKVY